MVGIPMEAKEKMIRIFEKEGELFLFNLPRKLAEYARKWKLTEYEFHTFSLNLIYTCKSAVYGDALIKAGVPDSVFFTEISALKFYNEKNNMCKLFDCSAQDGFMLIERIMPGYTLINTISDPIKRADAFADVFRSFHLSCEDTHTYPTIISSMEQFDGNLGNDACFTQYMNAAKALYYKINDEYHSTCLLHGDLNHSNILLCNDSFKAIDPKGIIGDPVFDISRYLLNELTYAIKNNEKLSERLILHMSRTLELPIPLLYGLLFIDAVTTAAWHLGNVITRDRYDFQLRRCEAAYNLYQG